MTTQATPAISDERLKPCPCSGKPEIMRGPPGCHWVECNGCGAQTDDVAEDRAIRLWNLRASAPTALDRLQSVEGLRALDELVSLVEADATGPSTADDPDDESVGWRGDNSPMPMTFGHIRRARKAVNDLRNLLSTTPQASATAQEGVGVKALEWINRGEVVDHRYVAETVVGRYWIELGKDGLFYWALPALRGKIQAHALDEAKAAAQADYERRIRSALTTLPAMQEPVAWRGQKEQQVNFYDGSEPWNLSTTRDLGFEMTPLYAAPVATPPADLGALRTKIANIIRDYERENFGAFPPRGDLLSMADLILALLDKPGVRS